MEKEKENKLCCDLKDMQSAFIVCYECYDWFQQIPFRDVSREGLTGSKFGMKIWILISGSCLDLLQTKTMLKINEET